MELQIHSCVCVCVCVCVRACMFEHRGVVIIQPVRVFAHRTPCVFEGEFARCVFAQVNVVLT